MLINIPFRRNASIFVKYLTKYNNAFKSKKPLSQQMHGRG
jgi:hypothetical protein